VTLVSSEAEIEGEIENISPKGALISCVESPPLEEDIRLVIKAPQRQAMNIAGKVIWSTILDVSEGAPRLGVGILFTEISEDDSEFLSEVTAE
jgi:Tfp pilus assembly protein PilZ